MSDISLGTVKMRWAFAEDPSKVYDLLFHVIPNLKYDVILGRAFLTATKTLSKHKRRITECLFTVVNYFGFCFLGDTYQRFKGILGEESLVLAVSDTGAERNVMDAWYA